MESLKIPSGSQLCGQHCGWSSSHGVCVCARAPSALPYYFSLVTAASHSTRNMEFMAMSISRRNHGWMPCKGCNKLVEFGASATIPCPRRQSNVSIFLGFQAPQMRVENVQGWSLIDGDITWPHQYPINGFTMLSHIRKWAVNYALIYRIH